MFRIVQLNSHEITFFYRKTDFWCWILRIFSHKHLSSTLDVSTRIELSKKLKKPNWCWINKVVFALYYTIVSLGNFLSNSMEFSWTSNFSLSVSLIRIILTFTCNTSSQWYTYYNTWSYQPSQTHVIPFNQENHLPKSINLNQEKYPRKSLLFFEVTEHISKRSKSLFNRLLPQCCNQKFKMTSPSTVVILIENKHITS